MSSWSTKKIGEVCNTIYGFAFKASVFNEASEGLPVIRIGDVDKRRTNKFFNGKYDKKYVIEKGDVLLGLSGSFKANRWEGGTALLNQRVATLRDFENKIAESFVFYQMPMLFLKFEKTITQLSVKNILTKHLENLKILYPSHEIQKQIVVRLDKIAEAQKLNDGLIQKTNELFQSLLHKELNPAGKNWDIKELGVICDIRDGTHASPKFFPEGVPLITSKNLLGGVIDFSNIQFISEKDYLEIEKRSKVDDGDILFGMIGTIGNPVIVHKDRNFSIKNVGLIKFTALSPINSFVYYTLLYSFVGQQIKKFSRGGTQKFVSLGNLRNLKIHLPNKNTQKQIVTKLSAVQNYKKQLLEQKSRLKELFDSTLQKSMQGD